MRRPSAHALAALVVLVVVHLALLAIATWAFGDARTSRLLRVCADPNNLPFTNEREEGFENRIAEVLADELEADVRYTWFAQRRGFIRNTLRAGACDLVMGIPAHALAARGIIDNVRGYTLYGDYAEPNPPARLIEAVARDEIDVAIAWAPLAGYFAPRQPVALELVPVSPQIDLPFLPFVFDIALGVRRGEDEFRVELERAMAKRRPEIDSILVAYGVPLMTRTSQTVRGR